MRQTAGSRFFRYQAIVGPEVVYHKGIFSKIHYMSQSLHLFHCAFT